jgi:hypothetical protein
MRHSSGEKRREKADVRLDRIFWIMILKLTGI